MKLLNFTIIKLTVCLVFGILIGYYYPTSVLFILGFTLVSLFLVFISYLFARHQFQKNIWFGLSASITMISIGALTVQFHNQKNFQNHYSYQVSTNSDTLKTITFRIKEVLKPGTYHDKYIIDILAINNIKVSGKSLLNIEKDSVASTLLIDETFITRTLFKDLNKSLNPHQFNYKNYLEKQYIYHQLQLNSRELLRINSEEHTIFGLADNIRRHINNSLKSYHFNQNQGAIINALLLGQRQDISKEIYSDYTNAGAIHILAISGLHIGILLMLLNFVLIPLERFKYGKIIKTILLVCLLWSFAVIAGLSASVTRAVTMFSIITIALNLKRPTNIFNTLAISMFVILLFKPLFIFDVGFQLSYLAVFSIVTIDPHLYKLWQPKNYILNLYWHTFTVTVAAQIGIIPLSLYYFHQFPGLFFISNLIIIPFLGVILGFGIIVILLASLNLLPVFIADIFGNIISLMNTLMHWISNQEAFIFKEISFSLIYVFLTYLTIIACFRFSLKRNKKYLVFLLATVLLLQSSWIYNKLQLPSHEFIIFHKSRHSLLGNSSNNKAYFAHDLDSITALKDHIISNYMIGSGIKSIGKDSFRNAYQLKNKTLFIIDSLGLYNVKTLHPDYILLRQSPRINLDRLIDSLKPKHIIADGSNYKSYVNRWERICKKRKLPFHQTAKKGAFIIKY
ncbi:ComEC/Rec2 family competence protein [Tamlana sp. 2_MG-2023]|uniref:ComEC/Rec2 family competence protein n=1 Tax=unclassified Tamlana TaxID=2614803 RepID=UPI0026E344B1|nr:MULTISPECIES: ComEC/Rec2 family competence protein [unclassified Tamlana]MDO6761614.1 ComEC/Rec2 family competence protein [Tamlana sp. 2_MG-2023]MDO6792414.1 ComEC/Rec2 family competence protein [Tamlana sp. 1_MG-2023]